MIFATMWDWTGPAAAAGSLVALLATGVSLLVRLKIDQSTMKANQVNTEVKVDNLSGKVERLDDKVQTVVVSLARVETHLGLKGGDKA